MPVVTRKIFSTLEEMTSNKNQIQVGNKEIDKDSKTKKKSEKMKICELCNSQFLTKQRLNLHIEGIHEAKKHFKCELCHSQFLTKQG